jgi:hypothetical protein
MAENQEDRRRAEADRDSGRKGRTHSVAQVDKAKEATRSRAGRTAGLAAAADPNAAFAFAHVLGSDGMVEPARLTNELRISRQELATAAGLSRDAVSKTARLKAPATQGRLRDFIEIIARVLPWAGSVPHAFAWYRAQPLPSFGDQTAEDLVKAGRAEAVKAYLSRLAVGGYA